MATGDLVTTPEVLARWPKFSSYSSDVQAALISDCSALIQKQTRITFAVTQYTELIDGKNYPRIWVSNKPIVAIIGVSVNEEPLDTTQGWDYIFDPLQGEILRGIGQYDPRFAVWWPAGRRNIEVVYTAGYNPIPDDVKRATVITMQSYAALMNVSMTYKSESIGDYNYTLADLPSFNNIPAPAMAILGNYQPDQIF